MVELLSTTWEALGVKAWVLFPAPPGETCQDKSPTVEKVCLKSEEEAGSSGLWNERTHNLRLRLTQGFP